MSDRPGNGSAVGETLVLVDDFLVGQQLGHLIAAGDRSAEQLDRLERREVDLVARQHAPDQELAFVTARQEEIRDRLAADRIEAYSRILGASGTFSADVLCSYAARAAVAGRALGRDELRRLDERALNLGQLDAGDPVLALTSSTAIGYTAQGPVSFVRHGETGLAVQFEASQGEGSEPRTVTSPVEQLFGGYGADESARARHMYVGTNAIREAVGELLSGPAGSERPSAASLVIALSRAGLSLDGLGIPSTFVEAARREIRAVAADPYPYRHWVEQRAEGPKGMQEGHTDVVDAEAWTAALLVERPVGVDEKLARTHDSATASSIAAVFVESRHARFGRLYDDRVGTVIRRLSRIDPALADEVRSQFDPPKPRT